MTTPGGAGTLWTALVPPPVLGTPALLMGSELPSYRAPALRLAPHGHPKPSPDRPSLPSGSSYVENRGHHWEAYIRNIIPDDMTFPCRRSWPYRVGAMLNFAFTEFYEVHQESCNKYCNWAMRLGVRTLTLSYKP